MLTSCRLTRPSGFAEGDALYWLNIDRSGRLDSRTLHAGRPVIAGEKWGCNVWLRQRPVTRPGGGRGGGGGTSGEPLSPWHPTYAAPRLTHAHEVGQTSTLRKERIA